MIDYPHATDLKKIAARVWQIGGLVTAVCHGAAIFADLLDPETGKPIVDGKKITGFTTEGEEVMGIMGALRSWNEPFVDEHAKALGAECM